MCLSIALRRPDDVLASGEHAGFKWQIVHNGMGYRCGYIRVPKGHPWFGTDDLQYSNIDVHGGITFGEPDKPCNEDDEPGWWLGFDCAHAFDLPDPELPGCQSFSIFDDVLSPEKYACVRTTDYVRHECLSLCEQARVATEG